MLDIEKAVEMINNGMSIRETAEELLGDKKKESTIRGRLKKDYVKNEKGKWILSAQTETQKPNKQEKNIPTNPENNDKIRKENNPTMKEERNPIVKKVTYEIDENIHYELRLQAFKQKKNVSELVEKALKNFLAEKQGE